MIDLVTELKVIGSTNNIFDTDMDYIIPLYQRAYACVRQVKMLAKGPQKG